MDELRQRLLHEHRWEITEETCDACGDSLYGKTFYEGGEQLGIALTCPHCEWFKILHYAHVQVVLDGYRPPDDL